MKLSAHLRLSRHGVYYFRCLIPKILRPLYDGKVEIKRSLNTRDPATAKREAYILSAQSAHIFHTAKRAMKRYDPNGFNPNDLSTWPTSVKDGRHWEITLPSGLQIKTDPNNPNDHANAMEALEKIGQLPAFAHAPQPIATPAPVPQAIKLSEAIQKFVEKRKNHKGIADSTRDREAAMMTRFLKWTHDPNDPPIDMISTVLVDEFLDYLQNVERGVHEKRKGQLPYKPIATPLSKSTVEDYRLFMQLMFSVLRKSGDYPADRILPTGNSRYMHGEKKKTKRANAYQPFNPSELSKIFNPEVYKTIKKPHEFFVPLMCLYTGARIDEICQLYLHDC